MQGEDVSSQMLEKIRAFIPELLDISLQSQLFMSSPPASLGVPSSTPLSTPLSMCKQFNVPYLGRLPLDPQVMRACEEGKSFLEVYPDSPAAAPFSEVVQKLVDIVSRIK
ncbi:hypothetical protein EON64_04735 [archaeon]|nr:MAG: hypothetical protein EON64_04735 [archaeon]